jgi:hypothetical protein
MLHAHHPVAQAAAVAIALASVLVGCAAGPNRRGIVGGATTTGEQVLAPALTAAPKRIYVADFTVGEGAVKGPSV